MLVLRFVATIIIVGLGLYSLQGVIFLMNQPSTLAIIGGTALLPVVVGLTTWALFRVWRLNEKDKFVCRDPECSCRK